MAAFHKVMATAMPSLRMKALGWSKTKHYLLPPQTHVAREVTSPGLWAVLTAERLSMWMITSSFAS
jgi:hypothetical protein